MDLDNFREDNNEVIILGLLDKINLEKQIITFWQNINDHRSICKGVIYDLDISQKLLVVKTQSKNKLNNFDHGAPVYFHAFERNMIFKSRDFMKETDLLILPIPSHVRVTNEQSSARFILKKENVRNVEHIKKFKKNGVVSYQKKSVNCINISQSGMAFELKGLEISDYNIGERIIINEVANVPLKNIEAEIIYTCPLTNNGKIFRVGIVFVKALSPDLLKKILFVGNKNV